MHIRCKLEDEDVKVGGFLLLLERIKSIISPTIVMQLNGLTTDLTLLMWGFTSLNISSPASAKVVAECVPIRACAQGGGKRPGMHIFNTIYQEGKNPLLAASHVAIFY